MHLGLRFHLVHLTLGSHPVLLILSCSDDYLVGNFQVFHLSRPEV